MQRTLLFVALIQALCHAACGTDRLRVEPVERLPATKLEPELRIDGYAADLAPISWLGVRSDGTIVITQIQDHAVRFFDSEGRTLGAVGRQGKGPGEFQRPVRGGWIGDTLWVSDVELERVTLISPDREVVRVLPPLTAARPSPGDESAFPTFYFVFPMAMYAEDTFLIYGIGSADDPQPNRYLQVSSEGIIKRLVVEAPRDDGSIMVPLGDGGFAGTGVPFFPHPRSAVAPDGSRIATVTTDVAGEEAGTFRVSVYDALGEQLFTRAYPFERVALPPSRVDSALDAQIARSEFPQLRRAIDTDVRKRVPPVYPPVHSIVVGSDHRIWVGLRATEDESPWLVLSDEGEPQARIILPKRAALGMADATHVWTIERDEVDVQSVVRYRISGR